ncbi:MAG: hypothetical protein ACD_72C00085G0002 [uncultured bacterium]|nr:MAG: hypothetical protein ACD_72C00085G0002 [uncultured bacterium]
MDPSSFPKLSEIEEKKLQSIMADPEKKYKLFKFLQIKFDEFDLWYKNEEKIENQKISDKSQINFLQRLISRFK